LFITVFFSCFAIAIIFDCNVFVIVTTSIDEKITNNITYEVDTLDKFFMNHLFSRYKIFLGININYIKLISFSLVIKNFIIFSLNRHF
jgi:hypothetical protein